MPRDRNGMLVERRGEVPKCGQMEHYENRLGQVPRRPSYRMRLDLTGSLSRKEKIAFSSQAL